MSEKIEETQFLINRHGWFHPNALSLVLGGCTYDMPSFRQNMGSLLYTVDKISDYAWNLRAQFVQNGLTVMMPISDIHEGVITNMNEAQKDHVMAVLEADHLQMTYYQANSEKEVVRERIEKRLLNTGYEDGSVVTPLMAPKIMTTNAAFFPLENVPPHERLPDVCDEYRHDYFRVHALLHEPKHLSDDYWNLLYPQFKAPFYPTQFVALHNYGVMDDKTGMCYIGSHIPKRYQDNPKANPVLPQDMWMVMAVQPYGLRYICASKDIRSTRDLLSDLEGEFIDPHYDRDQRLREMDEMLRDIPGSKPAHYSHFSDKNIEKYEKIISMYPFDMG